MAIPYYSMDLNGREWGLIFKSLFTFSAFNGPAISEYEQLMAKRLGVKHVLSFPSGRTGFFYLISALLKEGDEVIVSIFTFPLFVRLLHEKKVKPVFVDVRQDGLIDPDLIEPKINPKTKAVLVTHLFGKVCLMQKIVDVCRKYNLYLFEDCAHAFDSTFQGKPAGSFGKAAIFSTSPMKVPTTLGGGAVATNDSELYTQMKSALASCKDYHYNFSKLFKLFTFTMIYYLNSYPWIFSILSSRLFQYLKAKNPGKLRKLFYSELVSKKMFDPFERMRFSSMQARVGMSQINRHQSMINKRSSYVELYKEQFKNNRRISILKEPQGSFSNELYCIAVYEGDADKFLDNSMEEGIFLMREEVWYCPSYDFAKDYPASCPVGEKLKSKLIRLPNSSLLNKSVIDFVGETLNKCAA